MVELSQGSSRIYGEAAFEVLAKAQDLERQGRNIIHFEIGEPDMETPETIVKAGIQAIKDKKTHYTPSIGILELRRAVQNEIEKTRGYRPDLEQILIVPGLKPGIFFSMLAVVNPGDEVIFQDPGYPTYGSVTSSLGAKSVLVPLFEENEFRMNPDDIKSRINNKTKLIIVNSPQNPTGSVIPETELRKIADICLEHDIYVISDEIYEYLIYGEKHFSIASIPEMLDISITLNGFSKAYAMTGWRIGYAVGNPAFIQKMGTMQMYINICAPSMSQRAALAALNGPQDCVTNMVKEYKRRRSYLLTRLQKMGIPCVTPGGAFYAFPNISCLGSSDDIWRLLIDEAHVSTTPGNMFGAQGEGYLRLSYANSLSNIEKALDRIEKVVRRKT